MSIRSLACAALLSLFVLPTPTASPTALGLELAPRKAWSAAMASGEVLERSTAVEDARAEARQGEAEATCNLPTPSGRWAGRERDDDWARGLYPARERYPEGWLALTFDDGPHRSRTPIALRELARRDMHATFFLTGHAIRKGSYELVQRMVAEGHTLANHGWRHDTNMARQVDDIEELERYIAAEFELTQIRVDLAMMASSPEDFAAMDRQVFAGLAWSRHDRGEQLERMAGIRDRHRSLLESRGLSEDARPYRLEWARPPGGNPYLGGERWSDAEREAFARVLERADLTLVMWNHGSGDSNTTLAPADRRDPARIAGTARKAARSGGIYVAHDRIEPEGLRAMLRSFDAAEVEIVSLAQLREAKIEALGCGSAKLSPAG